MKSRRPSRQAEKIQRITKESMEEFGSDWTQKRYARIAGQGLWESEKILINEYFPPIPDGRDNVASSPAILDAGCGSGRASLPLARRGYAVTGVDITPEMIESARAIAAENQLDISYAIGDAGHLDFPDNSFDGALFANNGWSQIPGKKNRQRALEEIYRTLKKGGSFMLTAHRRYYTGKTLFYWFKKGLRHFLLPIPLPGLTNDEIDFGDLFFIRPYKAKGHEVRQFIHMSGRREVSRQLKKTGFTIVLKREMGRLSPGDAQKMVGSLSKDFNSAKSPLFYICRK